MRSVTHNVLNGLAAGFQPSDGPLQRVRVEVALIWFGAALTAAMVFDSPLALTAVLLGVLTAAAFCHALRKLRFVLLMAVPLALTATVVNALVVRDGATVIVEGAWLPLIGTFDVTREAVLYGAMLGYRVVVVLALAALFVAVVDPDAVLRVMRRLSVRSAITATLAARMVPMLARDSLNLASARECRPGPDPGTVAVARSVFARAFERAEESALALELRGFSRARRGVSPRRRLTGDEWVLLAMSLATAVFAVATAVAGVMDVHPFPFMRLGTRVLDCAAAVALFVLIVAPVGLLTVARRAGSKARI